MSKLHKKKINDVGKKMYLDARQKVALAVETDKENMALRQRISELNERAVAREKSRADVAERNAQEQTMRGDREEKRANEAENRLYDIERFIRLSGVSEAYEHWNFLHDLVKKAALALADWAIAQNPSSIMTMNAPLARESLPNASLTVLILMSSPTVRRLQAVLQIWPIP